MAFIIKYWYIPILVLIFLTGVILTIKLKGVQFRRLGLAFKLMLKSSNSGQGEISSFQALCISLSATLGTGNIIGVSSAIAIGGAGSLFWMFMFALVGLATKYSEGFLAIKYRRFNKDGEVIGGPFAYIEYGMGKKFIPLARLFAFFAALCALMGTGTMTQSNAMVDGFNILFKPTNFVTIFNYDVSILAIILGILITIICGIILFGGLKRISIVCEKVIPFLAVLYICSCLIIITLNISNVPSAFVTIVKMAFTSKSVIGGVVGYSLLRAITTGAQKGIFANEAGLGSTPIALATSKTSNPSHEGLISMAAMVVTMVVCLITGLVVIVTGAWLEPLEGLYITNYAFINGLKFNATFSSILLVICLCIFAFTSIIGWCVYGEKSISYLTNNNKICRKIYVLLYVLSIFFGAILKVDLIWNLADIFNGLMAIPNLIALLFLSKIVKEDSIKELNL